MVALTGRRLGLSSASAPHATAFELAESVRRTGGSVVDLRAGRDHRWEVDGIDALGEVEVSFVGLSVTLGLPEQPMDGGSRFPGLPTKVFAARGSAAEPRTAAQLDLLGADRAPDQVLIETHHGCAEPEELLTLCIRHGCRMVLDVLGLSRISDDFQTDVQRLAPHVAAAQVKGFDPQSFRHRALNDHDLDWLELLPDRLDITVESRAGDPLRDLARLVDHQRERR
jgi:hypothetical protein